MRFGDPLLQGLGLGGFEQSQQASLLNQLMAQGHHPLQVAVVQGTAFTCPHPKPECEACLEETRQRVAAEKHMQKVKADRAVAYKARCTAWVEEIRTLANLPGGWSK